MLMEREGALTGPVNLSSPEEVTLRELAERVVGQSTKG